jgi:TolA-binding protein
MLFQIDKIIGRRGGWPQNFWQIPTMWALFVLLTFGFGFLPCGWAATPAATISKAGAKAFAVNLVVTDNPQSKKAVVVIRGNQAIPSYQTRPFSTPPRLAIDFFTTTIPAVPKNIFLKSTLLGSATIITQPKKMRLMLYFDAKNLPPFTTHVNDNELHVTFVRQFPTKAPKSKSTRPKEKAPMMDTLLEIDPEDTSAEGYLWQDAVNAYQNKHPAETIRTLKKIITTDLAGPYTERATFLLAHANEAQFSKNKLAHIGDIRNSYEDALARFGNSIFAPDAMLAMGHLLAETGNKAEATAYFNLVMKKAPGSLEALDAALQNAKSLRIKRKFAKAMILLNRICEQYENLPQVTEAKIEKAKVSYETNSFSKSLNRLSALIAADGDVISTNPEIALYMGHNYYQIGRHEKARAYFFRFFNVDPGRKGHHLILAKIADSYKDQGHNNDAVKMYKMVLKRYPKTEGALISMLRLANLQEQGAYVATEPVKKRKSWEKKSAPDSPRAIYERVINELTESDPQNPLVQLAMLKLALLYQKDNQFDLSLNTMKDLMSRYPRTKLRQELREGLLRAMTTMIEEHMAAKSYGEVMAMAQREAKLVKIINSPEIFLLLARAASGLGDIQTATKMYSKCDKLFVEDEKPADLRLFTARAFIGQNKPKEALAQLDILGAQKIPAHYKTEVFELKGRIYSAQNRNLAAAKMYDRALANEANDCKRSALMIYKAKSLEAAGHIPQALEAVGEVIGKNGACGPAAGEHLKEVGQMHLKHKSLNVAMTAFKKALEYTTIPENQIRIKLLMAKGYEAMHQKDNYLALYNEIVALEDPFWSNLAREKLEEIKFKHNFQNRSKKTKG